MTSASAGGVPDIASLVSEAKRRVSSCSTLAELASSEAALLGKRSPLSEASRMLGSLGQDERRRVGRLVQEARRDIESALAERMEVLHAAERAAKLVEDHLDLSEAVLQVASPGPGHGPLARGRLHLVQRTRDELEDVFVGMGFVVAEGPEVETDWFNFEALNIPPAHPARGMWDTFYLDLGERESVLLRTHTSPVQIRLMREQEPPVYAVMPGRCYRRDTPDARHLPTFHQIEGLVVDRSISFADLAGTIEAFTAAYFGEDVHSRLRPAYFPFTEPSAEFEVTCTICKGGGCRTCSHTGWVELGGCGMVDPAVFEFVGIDPESWSGFAFGFGIDRCALMRHEIPDLRILLDNDARFLSQV
ncbi:MAG: phenylalanine--tRNA ligase subunit alpha [Actinobacteria bacterium]|nr:phenylalanine--tRNA ligase subunit alpha [Actinomycetota bacterium]MDA8183719.1 phenylalanine--tRNA ligase subunit alpha [Actinomycetota bacterium]